MDDDSLHTLLSEGRLSGAQRDRILERVLDEHASPRRRPRTWVLVAGVALPAAAILALVVGMHRRAPEGDAGAGWLVPKGERSGAHLEASCPNRAPGQCRKGDRLVFSVDGAKRDAFFAAYAECGSNERIWYFPTSDGNLPRVPATTGHVIVDQAARVGEEHGLGRCKIHLFLLGRPENRAALLSGESSTLGNAVVPLTIAP
ncbi:MAG TPA: hypothetical protein VF103_18900 [Polyangiaceae bacterium]